MSKKNLALVLHPNLELKVEERPEPKIKENEVLLAIHWTGICGTDLHMWAHGHAGHVTLTKPMILGHESSGTVVQVGKQVTHLKEGDRICVEPAIPCSNCDFCLSGRYNLCQNIDGRGYPFDGMCSHLYAHPAKWVFKLPDNVSFEEGALVEPLAVAVHACRRAGIAAGQNVLICGAGPVGLLTMLCAKAMAINKLCITDVIQSRLDLAKKIGADHAILVSSSQELRDQVKEAMGQLVDVAIDCCGSPHTVPPAILCTRPGGVVAVVGLGGEKASISLPDVVMNEVDIRGVSRYLNCYPIALSLLSTGAVDVRPLVTHRFQLSEAADAFRTASDPEADSVKVLIQTA